MSQTVSAFPSSILFNNYDSLGIEEDDANKQTVEDKSRCNMTFDTFCRLVLQKGEYPRLQVVERDSRLYTINNTRLALFQRLEEAGYCSKVKVELVPWKNIPSSLRDILCPPGHVTPSINRLANRGNRQKGYRLLESSAPFAAPAQVGTSSERESNDSSQDDLAKGVVACSHYFEYDDVGGDDDDNDDNDDDDDGDDATTTDEDYYYGDGADFESDEDTAM